MGELAKALIFVCTLTGAPAAYAADPNHRAPGKLKATFYSHSIIGDGSVCEGTMKDRTLSNGKQFDGVAVKPGELPKAIALKEQHNANGCTINFTSGPWAGQSTKVEDVNGNDTIDVAIDTRGAKNKAECQKILNSAPGNGAPIDYTLTDCPGKPKQAKASKRNPKATTRLRR